MAKTKEIIVIYQDCVLCGDRGEKKRLHLLKKGLNIRKVSVFSSEGSKLAHEAVFNHQIRSLPVYTDGEKFSYHAETFLEKPAKKSKKIKMKVEVANEPGEKN